MSRIGPWPGGRPPKACWQPSPQPSRPWRLGGSGGFSWYFFGPDNRLHHDIRGTLGNGSWGYIVGTYDKDAGAKRGEGQLSCCRGARQRI
jgi:hypothetical protein